MDALNTNRPTKDINTNFLDVQNVPKSGTGHVQVITPKTSSPLGKSTDLINTCKSSIVQKNGIEAHLCKLQQSVPPSELQGGSSPSAPLRVLATPMEASMGQLREVLSTWSQALSKLPNTPILTDFKSVFEDLHSAILFDVFDVTPDYFIVFAQDEKDFTQGFAIAHRIKDTSTHSIKIDYLMAAPWNINEEGAKVYAKENGLSSVRGAGTSCLLGCIKYSGETLGVQYPEITLDATKTGVDFYEKRNFTRTGEHDKLTPMHLSSDKAENLFKRFQKTIT